MLMNGKPLQGDESAERLALDVLLWIAGDDDRLLPFLAASGLSPDTLPPRAREPAFLLGVPDPPLGRENVPVACANGPRLQPDPSAAARHRPSPRPTDARACAGRDPR